MGDTLSKFVNRNVNKYKMAEIFAMYSDHVLRGNHKISDQDKEVNKIMVSRFTRNLMRFLKKDLLEDLIKLLSFVREKDLFYECYRKNFAQRLLSRSKLFNEDIEQSMLSNIKVRI